MFNPKDLKTALAYALKAMDKNNNRSVLTNIFVDTTEENYLTFVGADGYVLHMTRVNEPHAEIPSFFIPYEIALKMRDSIKKTGSTITWYAIDDTFFFNQTYKGKPYTWEVKQPFGKYPDYRAIMPVLDKATPITLAKETINKLQMIFGEVGAVYLEPKDGKVVGKVYQNDPYTVTMLIPEEWPTDVEFGINPNHLYNAHNGSPFTVLYYVKQYAPIVVSNGPNQNAMIMPNVRKTQ